ncbi:class I SAM-dependent methyltransferase [Methanosphaera sp. ISO3-F5]|uniref:class I SAM-dependent methyltransferase n=1 Tax=Methanosphaera sp. ISO3-F5 TaxID=1452353 RepID=UPI002B26289B|nr:class I SAM-dependent methyltransferase [Methanosphaera sp. ISO3-F5]WQH63411.1 class I SAM-dependent methyltransferase [Methanosphaera sp. ISO3-F5]
MEGSNNVTMCRVCSEQFIVDEEYDVPVFEENFPEGIFKYVVCSNCDSIQIRDIPNNLSEYYENESYYSFSNFNKLVQFLLYHYHRNYFDFDLVGWITSKFIQYDESWNCVAKLFKTNQIDLNSKVLDVGCGNGIFIRHLSDLGFKNLLGIEPFIDEEIITDSYNVLKKELQELNNDSKFDLICFKDSLEHVFNPIETLREASKRLNDEGIILITIPLKNGVIWDVYKEYSFVLCPPTHISVPSIKGMMEISKLCNLEIKELICDSNEFLVLMSEDKINSRRQYEKGSISSHFNSLNPFKKIYNLYIKKFSTKIFPEKKLSMYQVRNKVFSLNKENKTDHATIILTKSKK